MNYLFELVEKIGNHLVNIFHYVALFGIGTIVAWSAVHDYLQMMQVGRATLEDILLLFIYLELGAMVGVYFKTHRLPVQFLIYIAITALSRHLVIDVQKVSDLFHLYLIVGIAGAIVILSISILILSHAANKYGYSENKRTPHKTEEHEITEFPEAAAPVCADSSDAC